MLISSFLWLLSVAHATPTDPLRGALKHSSSSPTSSSGPLQYWDIEHYDISVWLQPEEPRLEGDITIRARATVPNPVQIRLHSDGPIIHRIRVDGIDKTWSEVDPFIVIDVGEGHSLGDVVHIQVEYQVTTFPSDDIVGLHWGDPIHSFNEPSGARRWLVVYDDPADKATLHWAIRAPSELSVVANGIPEPSMEHDDGTTTHSFDFDGPIPTYLMVLHAGTYSHHVNTSGAVEVHTWARPDLFEDAVLDFESTPRMIDYFGTIWGEYPWTHYANVTAPFSGAMEHTTATTFGEDLIGHPMAEVVNAHELAHHWFGNLLTLAEWPEIWLNEGFASYGEVLWIEHAYGASAKQAYIQTQIDSYYAWQTLESSSTLYDPMFLWGGLVYDKGSLVLHMLRWVVGDAAFFDGLAQYLDAHQFGSVTTMDFRRAMEDASGEPLDWFFDQWVYQAGDPSYRWGITQTRLGDSNWQVDFHIEQEAPGSWSMPIPIRVELESGEVMDIIADSGDGALTTSFCLESSTAFATFDPNRALLFINAVHVDSRFEAAPDVCSEPGAGPERADPGQDVPALGTEKNKGRGCATSPLALAWLWIPMAMLTSTRRRSATSPRFSGR
jgi:aminopeptidase N